MKRLFFAVALLSITACHKKPTPTPSSAALPIEVATPIERGITLTREYPGYLQADATIPIMGRVNGSIIKRNFTEGSRVKKGDLLFVIEPTLYENLWRRPRQACRQPLPSRIMPAAITNVCKQPSTAML